MSELSNSSIGLVDRICLLRQKELASPGSVAWASLSDFKAAFEELRPVYSVAVRTAVERSAESLVRF